jgi:hypothetical protein
MQVRIVENVWHEGRVLTEGEVHEIADEVAQHLLDSGLVEKAEGGSEEASPLAGPQAAGDSPEQPEEPTAPQEPVETPTTEPAQEQVPAPEVTQIPVTEPAAETPASEPTTGTPESTSDSQPSPDEIADTLNSIQ